MSLSGAFTLMEDMELAHDWLNETILNIPSQDEFVKNLELVLFNFEEYEKNYILKSLMIKMGKYISLIMS